MQEKYYPNESIRHRAQGIGSVSIYFMEDFAEGSWFACLQNQIVQELKPNDHQARRRFVEWAQNEMAVVPDFHKRIFV
ncbi:hypothetical protein TNCV_1347301 [Trichonephila clavipes]|nr:hypothetical protein TNCV_1347301 [Trichonephila clavipes]